MSQSFHLYQLQKIDSQIDQGILRISEIKSQIESDLRVSDAQHQMESDLAELKTAQTTLSRMEHEAEAKRVKLEQSEASLYGGKVHIPKELQDLQHEVASLKKTVNAMEDQQLEAMMKVEEAQDKVEQSRKLLTHMQGVTASETAVLNGESSMLNALKERLLLERTAILSQIDSVTLDEYNRLRKNKRGVAVATINEDACSACGTQLTAAERQLAHSPAQIYHCPSCGRFIYGG
jgi:predicted  nucleic acid-binding Zn-ribbon protein